MATSEGSKNLQSLQYSNENGKPKLKVLDQLLVPGAKEYVEINNVKDAWSVIRSMQIRGAPLIAIVACLGLAVDLNSNEETMKELDGLDPNDGDAIGAFIGAKMEYLKTARPTAVNVFHAMKELQTKLQEKQKQGATNGDGTLRQAMCAVIASHAQFMLERDVSDNRAVGSHGADIILQNKKDDEMVRVVTICNTGSLATAGYGTALGIVRALHERNRLEAVYALETRPYNQGSRLTAFELVEDKLPGAKLICDSSAAALLSTTQIDAVVVGADRVCANGDTANKIGTYNLAVVAAAHGVPFYVASPLTTLDTDIASGQAVTIEERPSKELLATSKAPSNIDCWNPAFDVTPAKFISGIITEKGVIIPSVDKTFPVKAFVEKHSTSNGDSEPGATAAPSKLKVPIDYNEQSVDSLPAYLSKNAPVAMQHLEASSPSDLECIEVGDGNLNLVFIVTNSKASPKKQIIVKQALPYVRCVGESWPLTLERSFFEYKALTAEKEASPAFCPAVYYFNKSDGLMVMEYIPPPNIILRKGLIQGIRYPTMAQDMGNFCAHTLFKTSGFALSETQLRQEVAFWTTNSEMCALTEQVIFTEPYIVADNNRWTSPQLDEDKKSIEQDVDLKVAISELKSKFVTATEALIHGDLHSGSVMCSPADHQTFVIDPEFAFYGPMGFDTGAFIANLFLAFVAQAGHENGDDYAEWILNQIIIFWKTFSDEFIRLWNDEAEHTGMMYKQALFTGTSEAAQSSWMDRMFQDTIGFAGAKMLRRIVGIAHVEDLESISDPDVRAKCERHGLEIAKVFLKKRSSLTSIEDCVKLAQEKKQA